MISVQLADLQSSHRFDNVLFPSLLGLRIQIDFLNSWLTGCKSVEVYGHMICRGLFSLGHFLGILLHRAGTVELSIKIPISGSWYRWFVAEISLTSRWTVILEFYHNIQCELYCICHWKKQWSEKILFNFDEILARLQANQVHNLLSTVTFMSSSRKV